MMYPKCGGHCCRQHQGWWPLSWRCVSTLTLGTLGALMPHSKSPTLQIQDLSGELQASPWWSFNLSGLSCDLCNVLWQLRLVNLLLFVGFLPQIAHHCQSLRTPKDFVITFYGVGPYKIVIGGTWLLPCCCGALQQVLSCQCFWAFSHSPWICDLQYSALFYWDVMILMYSMHSSGAACLTGSSSLALCRACGIW